MPFKRKERMTWEFRKFLFWALEVYTGIEAALSITLHDPNKCEPDGDEKSYNQYYPILVALLGQSLNDMSEH